MRVRPFFWLLLLCSCLGVLTLAMLYKPHVPAVLLVHVVQERPTANSLTTLEVNLTDAEGLPIDQAQVMSSARMTNMDMWASDSRVAAHGQGKYTVQFKLYMSGPWAITLRTQAEGFSPLERTVALQVE